MGWSKHDIAVVTVGATVLAYQLTFLARLAARYPWASQWRVVRHSCWRLAHWAQEGEAHSDDGFRKRVRTEVDQGRKRLTRDLAFTLAIVTMLMALSAMLNVATQRPRAFNQIQDWGFMAFWAIQTTVSNISSGLSISGRNIYYSTSMLCLCVVVGSSTELFDYANTMIVVARLALSLTHGNVLVTSFWNSVAFGAAQYAKGNATDGCGPSPADNYIPLNDVAYLVLVIFGTALANRWTWIDARNRIQISAVRSESSAVRRLLSLMCDATLDLDTELRIMEHVRAFAAMVRFDANWSTKGAGFIDFLAGPDRETIKSTLLAAQQPGGAQPSALHTSLRDSLGNNVAIEILFVPFEAPDGTKNLVVGVREHDERPIADLRDVPQTARQRRRRRHRTHRMHSPEASTLGRSTPPERQLDSLDTAAGAASGCSQTNSDRAPSSLGSSEDLGFMQPNLRPTEDKAVQLCLVAAMQRWNVRLRAAFCCPYHAQVVAATRGLEELKRRACVQNYRAMDDFQCSKCGVFATAEHDANDLCDICHHGRYLECASPASQGARSMSL